MSASLNLRWFFPAENPVFLLMTISPTVFVCDLVEEITQTLKSRGQKDVDNLLLYRADMVFPEDLTRRTIRPRVLQWLHEQPMDSELKDTRKLSSVFTPDSYTSRTEGLAYIDIIIATPEFLEMRHSFGKPYKNALYKCLDTYLSLPSPSEVVNDTSAFKQVFGGEDFRIHTGRPDGPPVVIFHPAFAALKQDFDHLERIDVTASEVYNASAYLDSASRFYDNKKHLELALKHEIENTIGKNGKWKSDVHGQLQPDRTLKGEKIVPDGSWCCEGFPVMVLELKNVLGLSGDALSQAVVDYSKMIAGDEYKSFRTDTNFPTLLLGITANRLEVAVAVSVGVIYVSKLLTLDLSSGFHTSDNVVQLARVFYALRNCRKNLEGYYTQLTHTRSSSSLFPNPTPLDPSTTLPHLTYRQHFSRAGRPTSEVLVDLGAGTTAMYLANLTIEGRDQEVIVKFTARYNEKAHRLLAAAQRAPKLYFCGRVVGDLYMIVMDRVNGKSVWELSQQPGRTIIPQNILKQTKEAVQLLHEQDIVFGDLRSNNILCVPSGDEICAVLVDFDWAGKDGESRYPAALNVHSKWSPGVYPYSTMLKAHDLWQLEQLEKQFT